MIFTANVFQCGQIPTTVALESVGTVGVVLPWRTVATCVIAFLDMRVKIVKKVKCFVFHCRINLLLLYEILIDVAILLIFAVNFRSTDNRTRNFNLIS